MTSNHNPQPEILHAQLEIRVTCAVLAGIGKLLAAQEEREAQTPQGPLWAMSQDPVHHHFLA
eukprot:2221519-Rhodomonas_salina.1